MVQETDSKSFLRLRYYNLIMGTVHLVQGILVLALATDFSLPVTAYFLDGPPGTPQQIDTLFEINIAWAVALFVFLSAIAHYAVSLPGTFNWYKSNLLKNRV